MATERPRLIDPAAIPAVLLGPRVRLEVPREEHAEAFLAGVLASMPALLYVDWRPSSAWALRFCREDARCMAEGEDLAWQVFARDDGGWVGRIDVHTIDHAAARGEIGYVGHSARTGQGLMREAALLVIQACWALGLQRIEAMSDARNTRALHFARCLGMQQEGVLRRHERDPQGQLCDVVIFSTLRPDTDA